MKEKKPPRGVTRDQWLAAAIDELEAGNVNNVTIEGLARKLGIAKSGFYWHFRDRRELLSAVLGYWVHELTEVVTSNPELARLPPRERLKKTADMVIRYDLTRFEIGIRQWAMQDDEAARSVRKVNRIRLDFVRAALGELGFEDDELEMRSRLFVCYHTWESQTFSEFSRKNRLALLEQRIDMLCKR